MKKKHFIALAAAVCAAACTLSLAGCSGHDHDYAEQYTYDTEYHWRQCSRCKDKLDYSKHSEGGDACVVCGYTYKSTEDPNKPNPPTEDPNTPNGPREDPN